MTPNMTYVVEIHPEDCAQLLASSSLGRLGVIVAGHPEIFPVNHVYDHDRGCVVFPTNDGTKLRAALDWPSVAYEVDGIAADGEAGWSVLVVGQAEEITDQDEINRLGQQRKVAWRAGKGVTWLRISPTKVTGRRICASSTGVTISWATDKPPLAPLTASTAAHPLCQDAGTADRRWSRTPPGTETIDVSAGIDVAARRASSRRYSTR